MASKSVSAVDSRRSAQGIATMINRKHGDGTVVLASAANVRPQRLPTGSLALDVMLGGGWPTNQWTELVGLESAGKSTVVLKTIAHAQQVNPGFQVAWVASESYDEDYATFLGVDNSRVWIISENIMEIAYDVALQFLDERACDMLVIDSLPALVPADEDEKSMGEWSPASGARRTNQFMRKATKATKRSLTDVADRPVVCILVNQWRDRMVSYGDPRTTPGGKAKNYWMYCRVEVRREEWLTDTAKVKVGQVIKAVVFKMKGAKPGPPASVDFYFSDANGVEAGTYDVYKETLNLSTSLDVVTRRGNAYAYDGVRYPGGKQGFYDALRADADLYERVRKEVLEVARSGAAPEEGARLDEE